MIINNSHIQGIYLYNETAEYEKGDFVIVDSSIYICLAKNPTNQSNNTVSGKIPYEDKENFTVYLGDMVTSLNEYLEYVSSPDEKEDKLVSSHILSEILNYYMTGFSEKGIINNYIIYESGSGYSFSKPLSSILDNAETGKYLDKVIEAADLNNCILRLSRNLPDLISKLPELPDTITGINNYDRLSVVLRQYTYIDSEINERPIIRVQELIDHVNGIVMYRYKNGSGDISEWKSSFLNIEFRNEVQYVKNYYENQLSKLNEEKTNLENNFGFRNTKINKSNNIVIQNTNPDTLGYVGTNKFSNPSIITVTIREPLGSSENLLFRNKSITIDVSDSISSSPINNYYITDTCTLSLNSVTESSAVLKVSSGIIINIYYRDFFKNE